MNNRHDDIGRAVEFDHVAESYDAMHSASIAGRGGDPQYFAQYKLRVLRRILPRETRSVLDFGCGIGNLTEQLVDVFDDVHGFDPSLRSLQVAARRAPAATLASEVSDLRSDGFDAVVVANVLHHVAPAARESLLQVVHSLVRPGGMLVVFEHNPLNLLTRSAVRSCEFDHDAVLLYPWEVRRRLTSLGLAGLQLDYVVFFPQRLGMLVPLDSWLRRCPLGAQVCAYGRRRTPPT